MKARTKKFQGRRYELVSWEEILEAEFESEGSEDWAHENWEHEVCAAIDEEQYYQYADYDSPLEVEWMRILHR